jgi:hypothetical protein
MSSVESSPPNGEGQGDYIMDDHDFVDRLKHWTTGGIITKDYLHATQLAMVFQCGQEMECVTLKTDAKGDKILDEYWQLCDKVDSILADDECHNFFKQLKGTKKGKLVDGKQLLLPM